MKNVRIKSEGVDGIGGREYTVEFDTQNNENNNKNTNVFLKLFMGVIVGFVNGFWGGGGGMICVPILMKIIKLPTKKAHSTTLLIMLPLSIASLIVYIINGNLNYYDAGRVCIGFVLGGIIGANLLNKISNFWIGVVFSLIILVGGIKLLI